jgi:hypothetical protein
VHCCTRYVHPRGHTSDGTGDVRVSGLESGKLSMFPLRIESSNTIHLTHRHKHSPVAHIEAFAKELVSISGFERTENP